MRPIESTMDVESINYRSQIKLTFLVVSPIMLTRIINAMSGFITMFLIAKLGNEALAAGALITSVYTALMMVLWSFLFPVGSVVARCYGAKNHAEIGKIVRQAIALSLLICIPVIALVWYMPSVLHLFGQPDQIINMVSEYFHAIIWGIVPCAIVAVLNQFFNGIFRPYITTFTTLLNVVVTIFLSYGFLFGQYGFPMLSIAGVGYAISITYWLNLILLILYLISSRSFNSFELFKSIEKSDIKYFKILYSIGWPISFQYGSELLSFTAVTFLMGVFGSDALAAQQISLQYALLAVMFPFAISQGSAVLVGQAYGLGSMVLAKVRGYLSLLLGVAVAFIIAIIFIFYSKWLISYYVDINNSNNASIVTLASMLLAVGAAIQFFDAIRNILTGALRGFHDTRIPMLLGVISCWVIGIPCAYILAFICHFGPVALRVGFLLGIIFGSISLLFRFYKFSENKKVSHYE